MLLARLIHNRYQLLIYFAGFDLSNIFLFFENFGGILCMLSNDKKYSPGTYSTGEFNSAEIVVGNPDIIWFYGQQDLF